MYDVCLGTGNLACETSACIAFGAGENCLFLCAGIKITDFIHRTGVFIPLRPRKSCRHRGSTDEKFRPCRSLIRDGHEESGCAKGTNGNWLSDVTPERLAGVIEEIELVDCQWRVH
jgi:hypothetical protein